jgi:fumarate reductase subunit C
MEPFDTWDRRERAERIAAVKHYMIAAVWFCLTLFVGGLCLGGGIAVVRWMSN